MDNENKATNVTTALKKDSQSTSNPGEVRAQAALLIALFASLGWLFVSILDYLNNNIPSTILETLLFCLNFLLTLLLANKTISPKIAYQAILSLSAISFSYLFLSGDMEGTGGLSAFIFPVGAIFFAGAYIGTIWSLTFFFFNFISIFIMFSLGVETPYTTYELIIYVVVYFFISLISYSSEAVHLKQKFQEDYEKSDISHLIENAADIIATIDPLGNIMFLSPSFERVFGYKTNEIIGKNAFQYIHHADKAQVATAISKAILNPHDVLHIEYRFLKSDQTWVPQEAYGQAIIGENDEITVIVNARDLTERKKAENDLQKINETLLKFGLNPNKNVNDLTRLCGELMNADFALFNCVCGEMLCSQGSWQTPDGYNPVANAEGRICLDVITQKNDEPYVMQNLQDSVYAETDPNVKTYQLETYIGTPVKMGNEIIGSLCLLYKNHHQLTERETKILGIIASAIATEESRRIADEKLKKSNERLLEAQQVAKLGSWEWDIKSGTMIWSDEIYRIFGTNPEELHGLVSFLSFVHPEDREMVQRTIYSAIDKHTPYNFIHRIIRPDGAERVVNEVGKVIISKDGTSTHMVGTIHDITSQKNLEEQLLQSQKMEAVGTLVGGIAHDFNNTLAAIQGNVFLARKKSDEPEIVDTKLENIGKLSNRAAEMVKQLLAFARKDMVNKHSFSLTSFMKEEFKLSETIIPESIRYNTEICTDELFIHGDATQLQQVLMNLLNNARDAVATKNEPKVLCKLEPFHADSDFIAKHPEISSAQLALISVEDNGNGITPEQMSHLFEPFYTTKEVGKGTGLGLAMVYGSIQSHGGIIEVESKPEKGTKFKVYLPLIRQIASNPSSEIAYTHHGSGETILFVDDQLEIRESIGEVLVSLGYHVLLASNGREAMETFMENRANIQLIISDLVMPEMSGIELVQEVHKVQPNLPVILATGYDAESTLQSDTPIAFVRNLSKPLDIEQLSKTILDLLSGTV